MFGLSIVKTADLKRLEAEVEALAQDVSTLTDKGVYIERKYFNLLDQVQRNDKAVRGQLDALAKPKACPLLTATPKHVTDPVAAWESKQRVAQDNVKRIVQDLYVHGTCKPIIVQSAPPSETAVVVAHKSNGAVGLLKGKHITILVKDHVQLLDVGDVLLDVSPETVHQHWNICHEVEKVFFNV